MRPTGTNLAGARSSCLAVWCKDIVAPGGERGKEFPEIRRGLECANWRLYTYVHVQARRLQRGDGKLAAHFRGGRVPLVLKPGGSGKVNQRKSLEKQLMNRESRCYFGG